MTYGAQFENDQGITVISDDRLIETFIGRASYSSRPGRRNGRVFRFYIASSLFPMVFIHARNNHFASMLAIRPSGSGFIIDIVTTTNTASDLEVYCFAETPGGNTETGYGMNVYDANGNPTFSSNWNVLNVRGIITPANVGGTINHGIAGLSKPAMMCPCNSGRFFISYSESGFGFKYVEFDELDAFRITKTAITTSRIRTWYFEDSGTFFGDRPFTFNDINSATGGNPSPFPVIDAAQYD